MSAVAFPLHDPDGSQTELLQRMLPTLKANYQQAFISVTPVTKANKKAMQMLRGDPFFILDFNKPNSSVRAHFISNFRSAAKHSAPDQVLHLCNSDRLAYALFSNHKKSFLKDTVNLKPNKTPLLYIRSELAWKSHPQNYYAIELMVTKLAEILFEKNLDYVWCHLAITAKDLQDVLHKIKGKDLVFPHTEIIFLLQEKLKMKAVDWLAWEDPFNLGKDAKQLKKERERDPREIKKRLNYALPAIFYLLKKYESQQR